MGERIFQVDAFTNEAFKGNPAGVMLLSEPQSDEWMQNFAREMNLSETAFLMRLQNKYLLRWFTPKVEVDLCGHATLASAHILFCEGLARKDEAIHFESASGILKAWYVDGWIELDFPAFEIRTGTLSPQITNALGFEPRQIYETDVNLLVEMNSFEEIRDYLPDLEKLTMLPYQGLIITCRMEGRFDFASRYFAPRAGINEDPVTGSSHCSLAPFWSPKLEKEEFTAYQASERGGVLKIRLENNRAFLQGQAVTIFEGEARI
ncbi:MAG: PhzF family phenazine biosynthesis protein [Chloroflexi bacterium]|nr:PhzF family phenazine biosynthesis protein [Chloroflexota bacterium]